MTGGGENYSTEKAVDASFEEVQNENQETTTAIAERYDVEKARHILMRGKETEYSKRAQEELDIDQALGLKFQAEMSAKEVVKKDIDTLTSSKDWVPITKQQLEKLFGFGKFKMICALENIKESLIGVYKDNAGFWISFAFLFAASLSIVCAFKASPINMVFRTGAILSTVTSFIFTMGFLVNNDGFRFNFAFMWPVLKMERLVNTEVRIPYGAKLKTHEAYESKVFEEFLLAKPEIKFTEHSHKVSLPKLPVDPAIVGATKDGRMFLIVYWDVENDKEKMTSDIKRLRKLKIRG